MSTTPSTYDTFVYGHLHYRDHVFRRAAAFDMAECPEPAGPDGHAAGAVCP